MNKNELVKDFSELSMSFYDAAKGVEGSGNKGSAPRWYMYRHSLELAIKAAIIKVAAHDNDPSLKIEIHRDGKRVYTLEMVHSIKELLTAYFFYEYSLFSTSDEIKSKMMTLAKKVDEVDRNSTFFRYPYVEKEKGKIKANKHFAELILDGSGIAPEIKSNMKTLICMPIGGGEPSIIKTRNKKIMIVQDALSKLIDFIFPIIDLTT